MNEKRCFDQIAKEAIHPVTELPKVIAIDEYKGDTKEGKYQLIIANGIKENQLPFFQIGIKKLLNGTFKNMERKYKS